ncbi:MAG: FG-GAP repeat domain-containing protein [Phycisphaerae bacterium]
MSTLADGGTPSVIAGTSSTPVNEHPDGAAGQSATGEIAIFYENTAGDLRWTPGIGKTIADDVELDCDCDLVSIEVKVSGDGDGTGPGFETTLGLYDNCPTFGGKPLPGTLVTMTTPDDGVHILVAEFPNRPYVPSRVWLGMATDVESGTWYYGSPATIGFTENIFDPGDAFFRCTATFANGYTGFYARVTCRADDCNGNGKPDSCDLQSGVASDCNENRVPDECDIKVGHSEDCDGNGVPDECQIATQDCNKNGQVDACDLADGSSVDCNTNGTPDECESDCNKSLQPDLCDILDGTSQDCNTNGLPDECDIDAGGSLDCDENGIPDECDPDCDNDGTPDTCSLLDGSSLDCNENGIPDECDLARPGVDCNGNGKLDTCDLVEPNTVFADDFSSGDVDMGRWPSSDYELVNDFVDGYWVVLEGPDGHIESSSIDLSGAFRAHMSYRARLFGQGKAVLLVEYWTGTVWKTLQRYRPWSPLSQKEGEWEFDPVIELPRDATHEDLRIRFRQDGLGDLWLTSIVVARYESDCDNSGTLDVCEIPANDANDCNMNRIWDVCERTGYVPGVGKRLDVGTWPNAVRTADFNADGFTDIAVGRGPFSSNGATLLILLNDGQHQFTIEDSFDVAGNPRAIEIGDFNEDGRDDIVLAGLYGGSVQLVENLGGAWWGMLPPKNILVADSPQSLAVADFNADGHSDIAVARGDIFQSGVDNVVSILINDGQANMALQHEFDVGEQPRSITIFDANGNGLPDLAVAAQLDDRINFYLNQGFDGKEWLGFAWAGNFNVWPTAACPFFIDAADFNHDGLDDLAVSLGLDDSMVQVLVNGGVAPDGTWQGISESRIWLVEGETLSLRAADLDRDGWADLVVGEDAGGLILLRNMGLHESGVWLGFRELFSMETDARPHDIVVDDINQDGIPDIVVANRATNNFGNPTGTPSVHVIMGQWPWSNDCNENGINDECDLRDKLSVDLDSNDVPDECQLDCNNNNVPDDYELANDPELDCNRNETIDECEIESGLSVDCDNNSVPDECETTYAFTHEFDFIPFETGNLVPAVFELRGFPRAATDVMLRVEAAVPSFDALDVWIGGSPLVKGILPGIACFPPRSETLYLTADQFNAALLGTPTIEVWLNNGQLCERDVVQVNPVVRTKRAYPWAQLFLEYETLGSSDCNGNQLLDVCELQNGSLQDCDADGQPDTCQLLARPRMRTYSEGVIAGEIMVESTGLYPPGYFVTDLATDQVKHISEGGETVTPFSSDIARPISVEMIPPEFTGTEHKLFVNSQTGSTIEIVNTDGSREVFANLEQEIPFINGFTYIPPDHPSDWANTIIAAGQFEDGILAVISPDGSVSVIATISDTPLWTPALAPADFGDVAHKLLVPDPTSDMVYSFDLTNGELEPFARIPLVEDGSGVRMISFSPVGWGGWLNRRLATERIVLVTTSGSSFGGEVGRGNMSFVDQRGGVLATFEFDAIGQPVNARGALFDDERLLICENAGDRILEFSLTSLDCDEDDVPDGCTIADVPDLDANLDGVVDGCELAGDADGDGFVTLRDWALLQRCLLEESFDGDCSFSDADRNGVLDLADHALLVPQWP